jgi:hypothetical protein
MGIMIEMKTSKNTWYFILLVLVIIFMIIANEMDLGIFAFALLIYPAYWLMIRVFENKNHNE